MHTSQRRRWLLADFIDRAARRGAFEAILLAGVVLAIFAGAMRAAM